MIFSHEKELLYLLEVGQIVIVVGETNKVTQILSKAGINNIAATQSRRDVANQPRHIRFTSERALIREMISDPLLRNYSVILTNEERNLNTDVLLGLLKCILVKRKDLKLIICSSSSNVDAFVEFFTFQDRNEKPHPFVLSIDGESTYPTKILHKQQPVPNYLEAAIETAKNIHESSRLASGKILIFLTGQDEVEYVCRRLNDFSMASASRLDLKQLLILPLHTSLKSDQMTSVFEEHGKNTRVCIVATSFAETCPKIEGVRFVIDCGFVKLKILDHQTGIDSLIRVPISKTTAELRAKKACRVRNGLVYRLYPESEYEKLPTNTVPEIQRSSLTEVILLLKSLGVDDLLRFPSISPIPRASLVSGLELLYALQAIDDEGNITLAGEIMTRLNLEPKISKMLVSPQSTACIREVCYVAAMMQMKDIYSKPAGFLASNIWTNESLVRLCALEGDMLSYLNIMNGFLNNQKSRKWAEKRYLNYQAMMNAIRLAAELELQLRRNKICVTSASGRTELVSKAILSGLFANAAYLDSSGNYKTISGEKTVFIHPTSVYSDLAIDDRPKFVVFGEILDTSKPYMRHVMSIERDWLFEIASHYYRF